MDFKQFVTPHSHPQSLDSASTPEAMAERELELGGKGLACTDHGSLSAAYHVYSLAKSKDLIPVVGLECYIRDDDCPILAKFGIPKTPSVPRGSDKVKWAAEHPDGSYLEYNKYYHATLGFRDFEAYKVAVRLMSKADERAELHGSERKPLFSWNEIEELAAHNVTMGSGCLVGAISRHLLTDYPESTRVGIATAYFDKMYGLFKDRFFIELFPHVCSHNYVKGVFIEVENADGTKETLRYYFDKNLETERGRYKAEELADDFQSTKHTHLVGVCNYRVWTKFDPEPKKIVSITKQDAFIQNECSPIAPNGDIQFGANLFMMDLAQKHNIPILVSDDSHFAEKRHKIVQDVRLAQQGSWRFYESYHRLTSDEAFCHFEKHHNTTRTTFESWIDNSYQWLEGFRGFEFKSEPQLPTKFYPSDCAAYIKDLIVKYGRMPKNDPVYKQRLKTEIDVLHRNGKIDLLPYFALANDVCRIYQNQGQLMGPARGSAGGCLLSYLIGITHIDPIKEGLSFERFLTKTRIDSGKLPDIDLDFNNRDLLIGYDTDVVEFEAADGTRHTLPEDFKVETDMGLLTIREALEKGAEFKEWWINESQSSNPLV